MPKGAFMTQPPLRPENRQRSTESGLPWADTVPLCFRSEAFAEDLGHANEAAPRPPAADGRGPAAAPMLGMALAAVWGLLGR